MVDQLTKEQAIEFGERKEWEGMSLSQRAHFQIHQEFLCMPFGEFAKAVSKTIGRPVYTHEFADPAHLIEELNNGCNANFDPIQDLHAKLKSMGKEDKMVVVTTN